MPGHIVSTCTWHNYAGKLSRILRTLDTSLPFLALATASMTIWRHKQDLPEHQIMSEF